MPDEIGCKPRKFQPEGSGVGDAEEKRSHNDNGHDAGCAIEVLIEGIGIVELETSPPSRPIVAVPFVLTRAREIGMPMQADTR